MLRTTSPVPVAPAKPGGELYSLPLQPPTVGNVHGHAAQQHSTRRFGQWKHENQPIAQNPVGRGNRFDRFYRSARTYQDSVVFTQLTNDFQRKKIRIRLADEIVVTP